MPDIIETIDFRNYTQGISIASRYARTVARLLVNAAPVDIKKAERRALDALVARADTVEAIRWERAQRAPSRIAPLRIEVSRAVLALHGGLAVVATVPPSRGDRGTRAAKLLTAVFPEGTLFVKSDAAVLWQEAFQRLSWIDEKNLAAEIVGVLGGPELLDGMREATTALGEVLGVGSTPREVPSRAALRNARRAFIRATGAYARMLSASVYEADPESVQRFLDAVAPLDEYRSTRAASDAEDELEEDELDEDETDEELVTEPVSPAEPVTPDEPEEPDVPRVA